MLVIFAALLLQCESSPPLALHQLVEVESNGEVVLKLHGLDFEGDDTVTTITSLPKSGALYQLSHIFSNHGYEPKSGVLISTVPTKVTGSKNRIVYKRDSCTTTRGGGQKDEWGRFNYKTADNEGESKEGTIVLVPPSHVIVESDFFFSAEDWITVGNRVHKEVFYERSSRGVMNNYIYALDKSLNIDSTGDDRDVWYFELPSKFHGWQGIMYQGKIQFDLSSFGGDFSNEFRNQPGRLNLVEITCAKCSINRGQTIGFPLDSTAGFDGQTTSFSLVLSETSGWVKDPKNTLHQWKQITKCKFIEVLSGITSVRILGDFTRWHESISIDNVRFVAAKPKGRYHLPVCAQKSPDARRCDCND